MRWIVSRVSVRLIGLFAALAAAQEMPIRVQTRLVQVPVSVTARDGRSIEGLRAHDFRVLDDGVVREITADVFDSGAARISLIIMVQSSAVPAPVLSEIRRIGSMIQPLVIGRRGEAAVVTFDHRIRWLQDFTRDPRDIQYAFKSIRKGSPIETRLLDAIAEAVDRLREREGRKVLLVISGGSDQGSDAGRDDVVDAVTRAGIEVFGARYYAKLKDPGVITQLAEATGGRDYPYLKDRGIEKAIEDLGVEVHSQYILSFPEPRVAEGMHQIAVAVPKRADLQIRSRQVYWTEQAR